MKDKVLTIKNHEKENKTTVRNAIIIVLITASLISAAYFHKQSQANSKLDIENSLKTMVKESAGKLPMKIDDATTMQSIDAQGLNLIYNYVVSGMVREDLMPRKDELLAAHRSKIQDHPQLRHFLESGLIITYNYKDSNGSMLLSFSVTK